MNKHTRYTVASDEHMSTIRDEQSNVIGFITKEKYAEHIVKCVNENQELHDKVGRLSKRGICDMQHQIKKLMEFIEGRVIGEGGCCCANPADDCLYCTAKELIKPYGETK